MRQGFWRSVGGGQFVVTQLLTIISTILGVYLAGYVGFERTLEYERLKQAEQQMNMLTGLGSELEANVVRLDALHARMIAANEEGEGIWSDWPELRLYLWSAAARNPALFEAPPETIAQLQAFYAEVQNILSKERLHNSFSRLSSSNAYERNQAAKAFNELLETAKTTIIPQINAAAAESERIVSAYSK